MAHRPESYRHDTATATGYVDWAAIFAGAVLALAISFVLLTFGSAIGLSVVSFEPQEGASLFWLAVVSGLWFLWVAITSFGAGGYLAGRLRRPAPGASVDEIDVRDGAHGLLVWATGALVGAVLAASGLTGMVGAVSSTARGVAEVAAEAVGGDVEYLGQRLMRGAPGDDAGLGGQVADLLRRGLADGEFSAADRDYIAGIVAQRTGQTPQEAGAVVDSTFAEAERLYDAAIETAETARVATSIAAFLIAATLLCSAAGACMAAVSGGDHRDRGVRFGN